MAKVKMIAQSMYIFADFSKEDIERVNRFKPEALMILRDNGDVDFRVSVAATPSVSAYGIAFNAEENGKAYIEVFISPSVEDKKQWAAEKFADIVSSLKKIEAKVETAKADIAEFQKEFIDNITVVE